jgi:hypothetical protein
VNRRNGEGNIKEGKDEGSKSVSRKFEAIIYGSDGFAQLRGDLDS